MAILKYEKGDKVRLLRIDNEAVSHLRGDAHGAFMSEDGMPDKRLLLDADLIERMTVGRIYTVAETQNSQEGYDLVDVFVSDSKVVCVRVECVELVESVS